MSSVGRDLTAPPEAAVGEPADRVQALAVPGPERDAALRRLHDLLLKAARHQLWRMRAQVPGGAGVLEDIANQAADDAMLAVLTKLHTFAGRSRFTTWAYKFAILTTAVQVRRLAWRERAVPLDDPDSVLESGPAPEAYAEAHDLLAAVRTAVAVALTPHQRRVVLALLADEVPVDVLAERLGTSRNALYKTLHDARVSLRVHLHAAGYLPGPDHPAGAA
jgi:RNA polymerase sigma-70 factor (ECF subfamily)